MVTLQQVEVAQKALKNIAFHTPLMKNTNISHKYGADVFLKREDLQLVRSYKSEPTCLNTDCLRVKKEVPQSFLKKGTSWYSELNSF